MLSITHDEDEYYYYSEWQKLSDLAIILHNPMQNVMEQKVAVVLTLIKNMGKAFKNT